MSNLAGKDSYGLKSGEKRVMRPLVVLWLVLFFVFGLLTIKVYPPVNYNIGDEIWAMKSSIGFLKGESRPSEVEPRIYFMLQGLYLSLTGGGVFAARSFSLIAATLALYLTYLLGKELIDETAGLLSSVVLGTTFAFSWHSRVVRSEMMTAVFIVMAFYLLYYGFKYGKARFLFYSSFLTALSIHVHPNSLQYVLGIVPAYLILFRKHLLSRSTVYFTAGILGGFIVWLLIGYFPQRSTEAPVISTVKDLPDIVLYSFPVLNENPFVLFLKSLIRFPKDYLHYLELFNVYFPNSINIAVVAYTALAVWALSMLTRHRGKVFVLLVFVFATSLGNYFITEKFGYWHVVELYPFFAVATVSGLYGLKERFGKFQTVFLGLGLVFFIAAGTADTTITVFKMKDYDYNRLLKKVSANIDGRVMAMDLYAPAFKSEDFAGAGFQIDRPYKYYCPPFEEHIKRLGVRYVIVDDLLRTFARMSCGPEYEKEIIRYLFLNGTVVSRVDESYPNYWVENGIISEVYVFRTPEHFTTPSAEW